MKRNRLLLLGAALASTASFGADRPIAVPPALQSSWEFVTPGSGARLRPQLGVGFWQRGSGAKPGVGANYVSAIEYQLPEAAPSRVRSASFQFSGKQSQCVGNEPVVVDVYAYAGDGKADVGDTRAGSRVAQFSANCSDSPAFARPIDVTAIVRQLSVASGIRHVGFNIRKANNRQGPGLFALYPGKLTVVLADHAVAAPPMARAPAGTTTSSTTATATAARRGPDADGDGGDVVEACQGHRHAGGAAQAAEGEDAEDRGRQADGDPLTSPEILRETRMHRPSCLRAGALGAGLRRRPGDDRRQRRRAVSRQLGAGQGESATRRSGW